MLIPVHFSFKVDVKRSVEEGEKRFNTLSIEERGKFDEETLVNVNSIRRKSTSSQRANGFSNEYIVVRFLLWSCTYCRGMLNVPSGTFMWKNILDH